MKSVCVSVGMYMCVFSVLCGATSKRHVPKQMGGKKTIPPSSPVGRGLPVIRKFACWGVIG